MIVQPRKGAFNHPFSILLAGFASGFVVLVKGKALTKTKKFRTSLLISETSQNI